MKKQARGSVWEKRGQTWGFWKGFFVSVENGRVRIRDRVLTS